MENQNSDQNPNQSQSQQEQSDSATEKATKSEAKTNDKAKKDKEPKANTEKATKSEAELLADQQAYAAASNRYNELFGKSPSDKLTMDMLNILNEERQSEIDVENAAKAAAQDQPKTFTISHKDERHEFPIGEKKNFIVRHSRIETMSSGIPMEDPGSIRIQIYRPNVYADLIHENEKTGERNAFLQSGEKTIVLHDPTKNG